ncbi:MAG: hypothetical protein DYG98_20505 [Haliscomenobacteraceae bacterium CHB4]|nr:hypothetical protein [Saprospiraceae bacterium]MCE7925443.1 hypothetical protein [Haliscomenobacteraceae bacterium CHB4]
MRTRILALLAVLVFFALVWLYVREFAVLYNTIKAKSLVLGSMFVALMLVTGGLWRWRNRFTPWERHLPEVLFLLIFSVLFAPLFGSLLNRSLGKNSHQSFEFVSETPYLASNYGILKGEKLKPTGYYLIVKEKGRELRFQYKTQSYYPLTKSGETVFLPVRSGLFGYRVVLLK